MTSLTITYSDDFTGTGDLDGSDVGSSSLLWDVLAGTWTRSNGLAAASDLPSANPLAVVDVAQADVTAGVDCYTGWGGGDALYFRVSDVSNWWRLRCRTYQTTGSYQSTTYTYGSWTQYGAGSDTYSGSPPPNVTYSNYVGGQPTNQVAVTSIDTGTSSYNYILYTRTATPHTTTSTYTNNYRQLVLEKCVAGVVSQSDSWQVSAFGRLQVATNGENITTYEPDGTTVHATVTDSFNAAATEHGVGKGGADNASTGSALDNFALSFLGSSTPPSILSPANGSDVDIAETVTLMVASNFGTSDPLTSADIQWRQEGDTSWTEVDSALSAPGGWVLDTTGLTAPIQIEAQVRGTDSNAITTDWSPSQFFTLRARPAAPTFVNPASGATVVAAEIATVNFDTDSVASSAREARRVGDLAGSPDPETVYEDPLTLTLIASGDDEGDYQLTGTGSIHPSGAEHIQARRQTTAGGTLWSLWADLPVTMSLAAPYPATVAHVPLPDDYANQFVITIGDTDDLHPAATRLDVYRDGVRVASLGVSDTTVTWVDRLAPASADYSFAAVADNGGQTVTD